MNDVNEPLLVRAPLEGYRARYTERLKIWETEAFSRHFKHQLTLGNSLPPGQIKSGRVLDSTTRCSYALNQMVELIEALEAERDFEGVQLQSRGYTAADLSMKTRVLESDPIYFSDFFTPGLEALAYASEGLLPIQRRVGAYCWAQTVDIHDFTYDLHRDWMRAWEFMASGIYTDVFVAHPIMKELLEVVFTRYRAGAASLNGLAGTPKVHSVGLPFNSADVWATAGEGLIPLKFAERPITAIYTSRFDIEKNPALFLDLVESLPGNSFAVCTGHPKLKGTDKESVERAERLHAEGRLIIYAGLSKQDYYKKLSASKMQVNCASQDWVSFTLLEALTFGCVPIYPMYRSFPSTLLHRPHYMYAPNDSGALCELVKTWLHGNYELEKDLASSILNYHDGALDRIAAVMATPY